MEIYEIEIDTDLCGIEVFKVLAISERDATKTALEQCYKKYKKEYDNLRTQSILKYRRLLRRNKCLV